MGRFITKGSLAVVILLVGLAIPCAIRAVHFDRTGTIVDFASRHSGERVAEREVWIGSSSPAMAS